MQPIRNFLAVLAALACVNALPAAELDRGLPEDTRVVLRVNLRQVLDAPLVKKYALKEIENAINGSRELQQASKILGLDPLKDIHSITVASPGGRDQKRFIAIVQGSFDLAKIHDTADKVAAKDGSKFLIHKQGDVRFYEARPEDKSPLFATFLSRDLMVVSPDRGYVSDAIAQNSGTGSAKLDANLKALVLSVEGKQSVWIASVVTPEMKAELAKNDQTRALAEKLRSLSAGITVGDDVKLRSVVQTSDAASAKQIRQQLDGLKALATLIVTGNQDLKDFAPMILDVLNSIKLSQAQNTVQMELTIGNKLIEKGLKSLK